MSLLEPHALTPRESHFLELARRLSDDFASRADVADRENALPFASYALLRSSGYLALTVPERFGGAGATLVEFARAQTQLATGDASVALTAAMNAHVVGGAAEAHSWTEALLERVCAGVIAGGIVNAIASEPELGSPSRGGAFRTTARRVNGGWRLNGRKTWATGGEMIDLYIVNASLEDGSSARFLVDARTLGVRLEATWVDALALRGSAAHDVLLEDVFVSDEDFIPPTPSTPNGSAWFWTAMSATYLGVGIAALEALTAFAQRRVPSALGQPIATLGNVQERVGEIELTLKAAQTVMLEAAKRWSDHLEPREALLPLMAGAKHLCTNAAIRATDLALRTAGGTALTRGLTLERHFRDARAGLAHPPSDEVALGMIGRSRLEGEK
jgi:alkylation response protein AidB-like acyl-CoA dehydrogenase